MWAVLDRMTDEQTALNKLLDDVLAHVPNEKLADARALRACLIGLAGLAVRTRSNDLQQYVQLAQCNVATGLELEALKAGRERLLSRAASRDRSEPASQVESFVDELVATTLQMKAAMDQTAFCDMIFWVNRAGVQVEEIRAIVYPLIPTKVGTQGDNRTL